MNHSSEISIVNTFGEEIALLHPTESSVIWNTKDIPDGSYFAVVKGSQGIERIAISVQH